jgi:hypothetical protein
MRSGRCGGGQAVGETQNRPFQLSFNSSLKVDFQGSRVTSDGGLVLVRELDERLGLSELMDRYLRDSRRGKNILPLADLLRQSIYSRLAGYEDVNDAARLAQEPTFRLIGSRKIWERGAALTSGGCESRVPLRGVVPPRGLHRDQSWDFKPGGGALLQQARHGGTMDQGRQAGGRDDRLSCHRFRANEVRLWLSVIAYNLGNLWRRLAPPAPIGRWSLTSLQQRLVKTGGRLIQHARYYWLLLAESHLTPRLFGNMLQKIAALPSPAG